METAVCEEHLRQELSDIVFHFPFNNLARVCRLAGDTDIPKSFGGDCLEQVQRLRTRLAALNIDAYLILAPSSEMHFGVLVDNGGGNRWYLDPTLNAHNPSPIVSGVSTSTPTYPVLNGASGSLDVGLENQDTILSANWKIPVITLERYPRLILKKTHLFDLTKPPFNEEQDLDAQRAFFATKDDLFWNIVNPETGEVLKMRLLKADRPPELRTSHAIGRVTAGTPNYERGIEFMARSCGVSSGDIQDFFQHTRERWNRFSISI